MPRIKITREMLKRWPHLRDVELPQLPKADVTVLIGMAVTDAHDVLQTIKSKNVKNAPKAELTPFGWCIVGRSSGAVNQKHED